MKTNNFLGKQISGYDPQIECSDSDLNNLLSQLNVLETLREIGIISSKLLDENKSIIYLNNTVPVTEDILIEFAYKVILFGSYENKSPLNTKNFLLAVRMIWHLIDKAFFKKTTKPYEILMYNAYKQFPYQESKMNALARTLFLYNDLWSTVEKANHIDILQEIKDLIGIELEELITICYAYLGQGTKRGFFRKYNEKIIMGLPNSLRKKFSSNKQDAFIRWGGADFKKIQKYGRRLNPIIKYPIIITHQKPDPTSAEVDIIPSFANFIRRIFTGLYFDLSDKLKKEKGNPFKEAFGYVFEKYVGLLLKEHLKSWELIAEIRYNKNDDTVDWFAVKDNQAILINRGQTVFFVFNRQIGDGYTLLPLKKEI